MHVGRMVAQGPLTELRARTAPRAEVRTGDPAGAARVLGELGLAEVEVLGEVGVGGGARLGEGTVSALLGAAAPEKVVAALVHADVPVRGFAVLAADLEEMFVQLTGEGFDVSG
jgi:ABC-2 type transport system ATP-binding protein